MSDKNIEKKLDLILKQILSIKIGLVEKGYIVDDSVDENIYKQAKNYIIETGKVSASLLQRKFKIGYAHASRMIDQLEDEGIVGHANGAKPREVL